MQFFPPAASTLASHTDSLLLYLVIVSGTLALGVALAIVVFGIRYRRRPGNETGARIEGSNLIEVVWTVIPLALLLVADVWGARVYLYAYTPPENALRIYGIGKQWMWKFQHPGGPREIDELHVPVGRPVSVLLASEDVIHSFYVPAFRIKQDAVPGRYTQAWFEATTPGRYHLFCAEYCGTNHSRMRGWVVAMPPEAYAAWVSAHPVAQTASRGADLFARLGCPGCHANGPGIGPDLHGLFGTRVTLADGQRRLADESYLREAILDPAARLTAGYPNVMPTYRGQVSEDDLIELMAYLRSLGPTTETSP